MCENDSVVDAWFRALFKHAEQVHITQRMQFRSGHMTGVIRELAATVPGVREWLLAHVPGEG